MHWWDPSLSLWGAVPVSYLLVELEVLLQEATTSSLWGIWKPARFRRSLIIWPLMETSSAVLEWRLNQRHNSYKAEFENVCVLLFVWDLFTWEICWPPGSRAWGSRPAWCRSQTAHGSCKTSEHASSAGCWHMALTWHPTNERLKSFWLDKSNQCLDLI